MASISYSKAFTVDMRSADITATTVQSIKPLSQKGEDGIK